MTMDTKRGIGALVVIVVVVGVFIVFVGIPATQKQFHYELQYPEGSARHVSLDIYDLEYTSTNISISFMNDPNLLYSIDVTQYESGVYHNVYYQEVTWDSTLLLIGIAGVGQEQVAAIDITLGTGTYYGIEISGHLLNVSIIYDNEARIEGQGVVVNCGGGMVLFAFTENVNFTGSGMYVQTTGPTSLIVDIDLPDGLNGRLQVPYQVDFAYTEMVGWSLVSGGIAQPSIYATASTAQPLFDILHDSFGTAWGRLIS